MQTLRPLSFIGHEISQNPEALKHLSKQDEISYSKGGDKVKGKNIYYNTKPLFPKHRRESPSLPLPNFPRGAEERCP